MNKLYNYENGTHYQYKGYTIFKDHEKAGERKYSYIKGHYSETNRFGHARTLSMAKTSIDYELLDETCGNPVCVACKVGA